MAKRANTTLVGIVSLFISLDGRIRRSDYWLGGVALNVIQLIVTVAVVGFAGISLGAIAAALAIRVLFFWPGFALMVKRGHDRNRSAIFTAVLLGTFIALDLLSTPASVLYGDAGKWSCKLLMLLVGGFIVIDYAFLDGEPGRNRFGPSPKTPDIGRPLSFDDDALPGGGASA